MWEGIHIWQSGDVGSALLPVLVDVAVKATVILLLAALATRMLRRSAAATRHVIWVLAASSLMVLPVLTVVVPGWQVLPQWMNPRTVASGQAAVPARPVVLAGPVAPAASSEVPLSAPALGASQVPNDAAVRIAGPEAPADTSSRQVVSPAVWSPRLDTSAILCLIWLAGVAAVVARMLLGVLSLWILGRAAQPVVGEDWIDALEQTREDLGIRRQVRLLQSRRRAMPMVWGVLRPRLLVPAEACGWPAERRRVVLLHELAHVKRWDCLWQLLMQGVCAVYWFHPLAWLAQRAMQGESEQACDDLVLAAGPRASDYAEHILQIASGLRADRLSGAAAIAMARPSRLEGRLLAILDATRSRRGLTRAAMIAAVALMTGVVVPVAMLRAGAAEEPGKKAPAEQPASVAQLPSGGTVELVGISHHPSKNQPWWRADGAPAAETFAASVGYLDPRADSMQREFVCRLKNLPVGASMPTIRVLPCNAATDGQVKRLGVIPVSDLVVVAASIPKTAPTVSVEVGVASGSWKTVAENTSPGSTVAIGVAGEGVIFSKVQDVTGKSQATVTFSEADDAEVRIVAVDADGREHVGTSEGGVGVKDFSQRTVVFGLSAGKIKAIRLQGRKYQWVKFENVALEPIKTADSLVMPKPGSGEAATQPSISLPTFVGEPHEKHFYVMGTFRPGVFSSDRLINLAQAVVAAGGLRPDSKFVYLLRPNGHGRLDIIASYPAEKMPSKESEQIQPGDVVYVSAQSLTVSPASQAVPPQGTVQVVGDVQRPGVYSLSASGTLLKSLIAASLDTSHIYSAHALVIRTYPDGQHGPVGRFAVADILQGRISDPPLESGDVIQVEIAKTSIPPGQRQGGEPSTAGRLLGEAGGESGSAHATTRPTVTVPGPTSMTVSGMVAMPAPGASKVLVENGSSAGAVTQPAPAENLVLRFFPPLTEPVWEHAVGAISFRGGRVVLSDAKTSQSIEATGLSAYALDEGMGVCPLVYGKQIPLKLKVGRDASSPALEIPSVEFGRKDGIVTCTMEVLCRSSTKAGWDVAFEILDAGGRVQANNRTVLFAAKGQETAPLRSEALMASLPVPDGAEPVGFRVFVRPAGEQAILESPRQAGGRWGSQSQPAKVRPNVGMIGAPTDVIPAGAVMLSHVAESSGSKRSLGGTGQAVLFDRPAGAGQVVAVQLYASRYGTLEPPKEDFHIYLLDENRKALVDVPVPYATVPRGQMQWYTFRVPPTAVPEQFYVATSFNAEQTKGIYLGLDPNVEESHSFIGLPEDGYGPMEETEPYDWMIRVYLVPGGAPAR